MNPFVDEEKVENLAHTLLYLHGPADRRTLCAIMYLCDADHMELYEDGITWTAIVMTENGPEPMNLDGALADDLPRIVVNGSVYSCGTTYPDLGFFHVSELETIRRVAYLALDLGDEEFRDYVMGDTPIRIAEVGEMVDLNAVFYRDEERSIRSYEDDRYHEAQKMTGESTNAGIHDVHRTSEGQVREIPRTRTAEQTQVRLCRCRPCRGLSYFHRMRVLHHGLNRMGKSVVTLHFDSVLYTPDMWDDCENRPARSSSGQSGCSQAVPFDGPYGPTRTIITSGVMITVGCSIRQRTTSTNMSSDLPPHGCPGMSPHHVSRPAPWIRREATSRHHIKHAMSRPFGQNPFGFRRPFPRKSIL